MPTKDESNARLTRLKHNILKLELTLNEFHKDLLAAKREYFEAHKDYPDER